MSKKRRKLKKQFLVTFILIILIAFVFLFKVYGVKYFKSNNEVVSSNDEITTVVEEKEVWPKVSKVSLVATGDGLVHNAVYYDAYDKTTDTFDFTHQLSLVKDIVSSYDIAYYNQETLFGGRRTERFSGKSGQIDGYDSYPYFNTPSEFGDAMVDAGFNLVSLASNHSADCTWDSEVCLTNSYNYWASKNVVFDGFNKDESEENLYNISEKNGIKYGFLNYTNTLNGLDNNVKNISYLIDTFDEEKAKKEIADLKTKVDVVIVAMHWHKNSAEYGTTATQANKEVAQFLADQGVDIILGTYSHCLQPFDILNNHTVVFYSLGNFISNQTALIDSVGYKGIVGVLASMDIVKTEYEDGTSTIEINNIGADLLYTSRTKGTTSTYTYKVVPFSKMNESYNKDYLSIYNEYSNILTSLNKNITIKEAGINA